MQIAQNVGRKSFLRWRNLQTRPGDYADKTEQTVKNSAVHVKLFSQPTSEAELVELAEVSRSVEVPGTASFVHA